MKFYNPFKPHIVTDGEKYAIRKFGLGGWSYLDIDIHYPRRILFLTYWWSFYGTPEYTHRTDRKFVEKCLQQYKFVSKPTKKREWRVDLNPSQSESDSMSSQKEET